MVNNQHLAEVVCAVRFDPRSNIWDSTFFGKYYSLIEAKGYSVKTEKKDVDFEFQLNKTENQSVFKQGQGQTRMVFSNPEAKTAIIITDHFISFHKISPYDNWNSFLETTVNPGLKDYQRLGLGKAILDVQCLYLNKYVLKKSEGVSKYFNFLPNMPGMEEAQIIYNGVYKVDQLNKVQLKLQVVENVQGGSEVYFECSSFSAAINAEEQFLKLAQLAHDNANKAYAVIIKK